MPGRRGPITHPPAAVKTAPTSAGATALGIALAVLVAARVVATVLPGGWAWGLNALRFLPPAAWLLLVVAVAASVPANARRALPLWRAGGRWLTERPVPASLAWSLGAVALVLVLPDRVHFAGDFLLREHAVDAAPGTPATLFPQAMPLDLLLHDRLARAIMRLAGLDANAAGRAIGALEAACLGLLAARAPRALGATGAAAFAAAHIVFWGGALGLMTGYNKSLSDLGLLTTAVGLFGVDVANRGRGGVALGASLALGLAVHRAGLLLVPAAGIAFALGLSRTAARGASLRGMRWGAAIALATLGVLAPRLVAVITRFDPRTNFAPAEVMGAGGPLAAALAGTRPLDLVNLLVFVAPLVLVIPFVTAARWRDVSRSPAAWVLASLVVPLVGFLPFFHPSFGLFRNWDDAAATGAALGLAAAWIVSEVAMDPRGARLAVTATLVAVTAMIQELWLAAAPDRGLRQIDAFAAGPPAHAAAELGWTWDFLGFRYTDLDRWDAGANAFEHAAAIAPSPRTLRAWAAVEILRSRPEHARALYHRLLERKPDEAVAWLELATLSMRMGDAAEARRAATALLNLDPGNADARLILEDLGPAP